MAGVVGLAGHAFPTAVSTNSVLISKRWFSHRLTLSDASVVKKPVEQEPDWIDNFIPS
jgi:hypothetical protein